MNPDLAHLADEFLDGDLAAARWELLLAEHGEPLRQALAEAEAVRSSLRNLPRSPLPPELRTRIAAAVADAAPAVPTPVAPPPPPLRPQLGAFWRYGSPLAAAAALLIAITLTLMNPPPDGPPKSPERTPPPSPPTAAPAAPAADAPANPGTARTKSRAVLEPAADAVEKSAASPAPTVPPSGNAAVADRGVAAPAVPATAPATASVATAGKPTADSQRPAPVVGGGLPPGAPAAVASSIPPLAPASPAPTAAFAGAQQRAAAEAAAAPAAAAPATPIEAAKKPAAAAADGVSEQEMANLRRDAEAFRKQLAEETAGLNSDAKAFDKRLTELQPSAMSPAAAKDAAAMLDLALAIAPAADGAEREKRTEAADAKRAAADLDAKPAVPVMSFTLRNHGTAEVVLPAGELVLEGLDANHLTSWVRLLRSRSETRIPAGQAFTWQEPLPPLRWQNPVIDKAKGRPAVAELRLRLRSSEAASPTVPAPPSPP